MRPLSPVRHSGLSQTTHEVPIVAIDLDEWLDTSENVPPDLERLPPSVLGLHTPPRRRSRLSDAERRALGLSRASARATARSASSPESPTPSGGIISERESAIAISALGVVQDFILASNERNNLPPSVLYGLSVLWDLCPVSRLCRCSQPTASRREREPLRPIRHGPLR